MAENKKSFVLYADLIHTVKKMPSEKAGLLFKKILEYVNDQDPQDEDMLVDIVFEPIKQQFKRDLVKWEDIKETKSQNGIIGNLKRWNLELYKQFMDKKITLEQAVEIANGRKPSQPDRTVSQTVANVAVNVNVNDTVTNKDKENIIFSFQEFWDMYPNKTGKVVCEKKYEKLSDNDMLKIKKTLPAFCATKPFADYNFPNPATYLTQKRFEDDVVIKKDDEETEFVSSAEEVHNKKLKDKYFKDGFWEHEFVKKSKLDLFQREMYNEFDLDLYFRNGRV